MAPGEVGKVSVNARAHKAGVQVQLVIVNTIVEVEPKGTEAGEKALVSVACGTTTRLAVALLVRLVETPVTLAGRLLYVPAVAAVTTTPTVQLATPAVSEPAVKLIVPLPTVPATVPPHCEAAGAE